MIKKIIARFIKIKRAIIFLLQTLSFKLPYNYH